MLQVNEDINDELFRRAAESYPLKTDNPEWESVLHKINTADTSAVAEPIAKKRKNNSRWFLLLLLLIPLAIFENKNSPINDQLAGKSKSPGKRSIAQTTEEKERLAKSSPETVLHEGTATTASVKNENAQTTNPETVNSTEPIPVQINTQKNNNSVHAVTDHTVTANHKKTFSSKQRSKVAIKNATAVEDEEIPVQDRVSKNKSKGKKDVSLATNITTDTQKEITSSVKKDTNPEDKTEVTETAKNTEPLTTATAEETVPAENDKTTAATDNKPKQVEKEIVKTDEKKPAKEDKKEKKHTKRFYIGLVAAPDLSAIKLQSLKKVGLNYGFIAGYKLTKKISIETGLLQDRKYYSSDGKYFSTKNIYMPANAKIEYVDGVCKMLEWPVNVSYTFSQRKRSGWFGSVGVSSYFMQHESYVYNVNYNGYVYPKAYDYDNKSTSLFAMINISAGYTYKLSKIGDLRFEPYIKLPVRKIGTGELPIQSAGIFVGFTKTIF